MTHFHPTIYLHLVNGNWTSWSPWSSCTVSCDGGITTKNRTRTRSCTNPTPESGGQPCSGSSNETESCDSDIKCPSKRGETHHLFNPFQHKSLENNFNSIFFIDIVVYFMPIC